MSKDLDIILNWRAKTLFCDHELKKKTESFDIVEVTFERNFAGVAALASSPDQKLGFVFQLGYIFLFVIYTRFMFLKLRPYSNTFATF